MTTEEENELLCQELLGWTRCDIIEKQTGQPERKYHYFYGPAFSVHVKQSFTDWQSAGLILDELERRKCVYKLGFDTSRHWVSLHEKKISVFSFGDTSPLAIRSAALEYLRQK